MPSLKTLLEKEKQRKNKLAESTQSLGFSQAFEFGERSNLEYVVPCPSSSFSRFKFFPFKASKNLSGGKRDIGPRNKARNIFRPTASQSSSINNPVTDFPKWEKYFQI